MTASTLCFLREHRDVSQIQWTKKKNRKKRKKSTNFCYSYLRIGAHLWCGLLDKSPITIERWQFDPIPHGNNRTWYYYYYVPSLAAAVTSSFFDVTSCSTARKSNSHFIVHFTRKFVTVRIIYVYKWVYIIFIRRVVSTGFATPAVQLHTYTHGTV